jgi:hypothetical protein
MLRGTLEHTRGAAYCNIRSKMAITVVYTDKIIHFLGGFFISTCLQTGDISMVFPAVLVGTGKELYDKYYKKTKFDWVDLLATVVGGFAAFWIKLAYR